MKRKIVVVTAIAVLAMSMVACGKSADVVETSAVEEPKTETVEDVKTEAVESVKVEETEPITEEVEEAATEFTGEMAMEKVQRLFAAYDEIMKSGKDVEYLIEDRCERLELVNHLAETTKDNLDLNGSKSVDSYEDSKSGTVCFAVGQNYYYNYVNNNSSYYDFAEYITSHTADEIIDEVIGLEQSKVYYENDIDSNYRIMGEAIGCIPFMIGHDITATTLISGEDCTCGDVNGINIMYEVPILLDNEDSGIIAVFDEFGNLLNFNTENAYDKFEYKTTFDTQE